MFVVEGNTWQFKALDKTQSQGTFKLDPEKKPKAIDVAGAGDKKTILGIYSLEKDKLTLCFPDRGNERRPSEFSSTKDNKCALLVLERRK